MLRITQDGAPHPGLAAHHGAALLLRPLQGDQTIGAFPHRVPHQVSATYHTALSWLSNTPSAATTRVWRRTRCTTTCTRCVSTLSRYLYLQYLHIYNIYISAINTYLQYLHIYRCGPTHISPYSSSFSCWQTSPSTNQSLCSRGSPTSQHGWHIYNIYNIYTYL